MTEHGDFHNVRWSGTATGWAVVAMKAGDTISHPLLGNLTIAKDGIYRVSDHGVLWWRSPDSNSHEDAR